MQERVISGNLSKQNKQVGGELPGTLVFGIPGPQGPVGPQGPEGPAGPVGPAPVKGVDYWTAADRQAIVTETLAALPTWEGGSY